MKEGREGSEEGRGRNEMRKLRERMRGREGKEVGKEREGIR